MNQESFKRFTSVFKAKLHTNGLAAADLPSFIKKEFTDEKDVARINGVIKESIIREQYPTNRSSFKEVVGILDELLALGIDVSALETTRSKVISIFRKVFSIVFFIVISVTVLGGVLGGYSLLLNEYASVLSLLLLLFLMFLLFSYEGLQISVATLKLKNLAPLKNQYPISDQLHKRFKSKTNEFYAGRQLFVIVTVFFIARITSFEGYTLIPFTNYAFPDWYRVVFIDYGMAGALFVLWFGQLTPQFIADNYPHGFLNFRVMDLLLRLAYFVESMELTRPGDWLARLAKKKNDINIAPEEKYRLDTVFINGYGLVGLKKEWRIKKDAASLSYQSIYSFHKSGTDKIVDPGLMVFRQHMGRHAHAFQLIRNDQDAAVYSDDNIQSVEYGNKWSQFLLHAAPQEGSFQKGDKLIVSSDFDFQEAFSDKIEVEQPTKYVFFKVIFEGQTDHSKHLEVCKFKKDAITGNMVQNEQFDVEVTLDEEQNAYAEFVDFFPEVDTSYTYKWK